jgi:broad specificity phosphatase PhoE
METTQNMKTIHLVRHGESEYNFKKHKHELVSKNFQVVNDDLSLWDCSLTEVGVEQAKVQPILIVINPFGF